MNYTFMAPGIGVCVVTLWSTGRYGFSLPKKVEISTPAGDTSTFLYVNRRLKPAAELTNRSIVEIAVARFLEMARAGLAPFEIDADMRAFDGELTPVAARSTRAPMRVRPGRVHARMQAPVPAPDDASEDP